MDCRIIHLKVGGVIDSGNEMVLPKTQRMEGHHQHEILFGTGKEIHFLPELCLCESSLGLRLSTFFAHLTFTYKLNQSVCYVGFGGIALAATPRDVPTWVEEGEALFYNLHGRGTVVCWTVACIVVKFYFCKCFVG
jgi:hypothetical protein